jgi:hypothetical protein
MDDMNISMELFKENFLELLTPAQEKRFTDLSTKTKTAFTRNYNQMHQSSIKKVRQKKGCTVEITAKKFDPTY